MKILNSRLHLLHSVGTYLLNYKLAFHAKITICKSLLRPIDCSPFGPMQFKVEDVLSHLKFVPTLQAFQSVTLRIISSAPYVHMVPTTYVSLCTLQND